MANNINAILAGIERTFKTTDNGGVHTTHHIAERDTGDPMLALVGDGTSSPPSNSLAWYLKAVKDQTDTVESLLTSVKDAVESVLPVQIYTSNSYNNITSKTTTAIKSGTGTLERVVINKTGATDTIAIYDSLAGSGTLIATINTPTIGMNFVFNCAFGTGLTIVTGGGTAGDYTVIYR